MNLLPEFRWIVYRKPSREMGSGVLKSGLLMKEGTENDEMENQEGDSSGTENELHDSPNNTLEDVGENETPQESEGSETEGESAAAAEGGSSDLPGEGETEATEGTSEPSDYTEIIEAVSGVREEFTLIHQTNTVMLFMLAVVVGVMLIRFIFDGLKNI